MSRRRAVTVALSPALALAGCQLVEQGRKLVVLDADGRKLERAGCGSWEWLFAVCEQLLIERWADALGLQHELHFEHLQMRLWRSGENPETAPWWPFEAALAWLAQEAARAAAEAQRLAVEARRWVVWFLRHLGMLLQGVCRLRVRVRCQGARIVSWMGVIGQVVSGPSAAWAWTAGRGPPVGAGAEA